MLSGSPKKLFLQVSSQWVPLIYGFLGTFGLFLFGETSLHGFEYLTPSPSSYKRASDEEIEQRSLKSLERARIISKENDRRTLWVFGLSGQKLTLKSGDEYEVLGNQATIHLGMSHFANNWYLLSTADIVLGPYEPTKNQQIDVDFFGTGLTTWIGFSAQTLDIRSSAGGYGFALGLTYGDLVGRSYGRNRKDSGTRTPQGLPPPDSEVLIETYSMRITNFSISPGLFFSWLKEARPLGNSKELLTTRIEGSILTIGLAVPLDTTYSAKSVLTDKTSQRSNGRLRGYTILATWSAVLST